MAFPVSVRFKDALPYSHQISSRVDITDLETGTVLMTMDAVTEGEVTEDRDQSARRRATFTAIDTTGTLTPTRASSLLAPYGNEFRPYKGITFPDGTTEYVTMGVFGILAVDILDSGENFTMKIEGDDRSAIVSRAGFSDTLSIPVGTGNGDAAVMILNAIGLGWLDTDLMNNIAVATKTYNIGDDPWKAIQELFTSCGCNVFFDETGVLVSRTLRDYTAVNFDWTMSDGPQGNLLAIERQMKRDDSLPNYIVVTGEHPDNATTIPTGVAYDDDPLSPTYIYGKYGTVFQHVLSTTITNNSDAQQMAQHLLGEVLGQSEQVIYTMLPNPAMQVDDLVLVTRTEAGLNSVGVVLDQVTHPLVAVRGGQAISRRRTLLA